MQMHITAKGVKFKQDIRPHECAVQQIIEVSTGEVKVAHSGATLSSVAIGSCIAVAALDLEKRIGAIAHIMLPGRSPESCAEKTRYADDAIEEMLNQMLKAGTNANDIEVCLVGAGNVLQKEDDTICDANIESVTGILKEKNISVIASLLGGTKRKSVFMDIENGSISYTEGDDPVKLLWRP
ncbi:MAG: chemotaxis protein CheD [Planctomycetes bacterium]|nr:chemotaxis protein CheD [Planctomycetota bacterium]